MNIEIAQEETDNRKRHRENSVREFYQAQVALDFNHPANVNQRKLFEVISVS